MCLFQMFAFMCVSAESVGSRGGKIRGGVGGGGGGKCAELSGLCAPIAVGGA